MIGLTLLFALTLFGLLQAVLLIADEVKRLTVRKKFNSIVEPLQKGAGRR